jgi:hypothetical protein
MKLPSPRRLFLLSLLAFAGGCDNVGRAFDPDLEEEEPDPDTVESIVQEVPVGGDAVEGRPRVRNVQPEGPGWPPEVPVVIEFSESVNETSILPTTTAGNDGRIILRVTGTTTALPCAYDFLASGRVLVLRPVTALSNEGTPTYEVVLLPEARDVDGVRFEVPEGGDVLSSFQVNQDETFTDGRILATYPRDNQKLTRESDLVVVFDRPANATSVTLTSFVVQPADGAPLAGERRFDLTTIGVNDARVLVFRPDAPLAGSTEFEIVVTEDITFGQDGNLDFRGRTPFSRFETVGPAAAVGVELGNPTTGFDNKVNRSNVGNPVLRVTTPADAQAGDRIRARIYGGDKETTAVGDLGFVERTADVPASGAQTVDIDFTEALGTLEKPEFDDGELTFAVQMQRGSETSGFIHQDESDTALFDITPPTFTTAGPPASAEGVDLLTNLEFVTFYGRASEAVASASLVVGAAAPVELFGSSDGGNFINIALPTALARQGPTTVGYSLTLRDRAGNFAAAPVTGNIVRRGFVTGAMTGTLTVEAFDRATLLPIAGATVLVDVGVPVIPQVGQQVATTDASGIATIAGLVPAARHTVTIVRAGYDLVTLYDTGAGYVSLPLVPQTNATATWRGTAQFVPTAATTAIVSNTALADRGIVGVRTSNTAPNTVPETPILANRPQLITGFAGRFEPTSLPTFDAAGCNVLGPDLQEPSAPGAPAAGGSESVQSVRMDPLVSVTPGAVGALSAPWVQDFGLATGLDLANLVGGLPRVRVATSLRGFEGQALIGIGFANPPSVTSFSMSMNVSVAIFEGLQAFGPLAWIVADAEDTAGRVSRCRGSLSVGVLTFVALSALPTPIPVITAPTGSSAVAPAVTLLDVLDQVPGGQSLVELTATDAAGRRWVLFAVDRDGLGSDTLQFPDLVSANVAGLATGDWTVRAEGRLWASGFTGATFDDFTISDRTRLEVTYVRSAPVTFNVQ